MRRLLFAAVAGAWALRALAFANAPIGSVIENVSMPGLDGRQHNLLGEGGVSVFLFLKPGMHHSSTTLVQIARCQKEMAGKPVHWCAVVSDRIPRAEVEQEVKSAGLEMPVLIDKGDVLYGKLGVVLHPVLGITDKDHKLLAYQPFAKVNYAAVVRARILHALKEISDEEMERTLHPPEIEPGGSKAVARRYLKLAERQFESGNYEQALANAGKSLDYESTAAAHTMRGRILSALGKPAEAQAAFDTALKLDPTISSALEKIKPGR